MGAEKMIEDSSFENDGFIAGRSEKTPANHEIADANGKSSTA